MQASPTLEGTSLGPSPRAGFSRMHTRFATWAFGECVMCVRVCQCCVLQMHLLDLKIHAKAGLQRRSGIE